MANFPTEQSPDDNQFNPFARSDRERMNWLNSLHIPVVDHTDEKLKIIQNLGAGNRSKVYAASLENHHVALKVLRHRATSGLVRTQEDRSFEIRVSFAGLLLAHKLYPENFPKPIAQYNYRGRPSGIIMEMVKGEPLIEDVDVQACERTWQQKPGSPYIYKADRQPPTPRFLARLDEITKGLHSNNLSLSDRSPENIIKGHSDDPIVIDVVYSPYYPRKDDRLQDLRFIRNLAGYSQ